MGRDLKWNKPEADRGMRPHRVGGPGPRRDTESAAVGGIVSRVEAIIIKSDGSADWTPDERFAGGEVAFGFILPRVKRAAQTVHWAEVPADYDLESE